MKKAYYFIILALISMNCFSQKDFFDSIAVKQSWAEYTIGTIEKNVIKSKYNDEEYDISIYLPPSYNHTDKDYPLLILTDAFHSFGIAENCCNLMLSGNEIPEIIIVGIGFNEHNTINFVRKRMRDLAYASSSRYRKYSDVESFYKFLSIELYPQIENKYRIDKNNKTYNGFSAGANFGIYLLLKHPEFFNNYIIGSPGFWWDNKNLLQMAEDNLPNFKPQKYTRIYTYSGEFDMAQDCESFRDILLKNEDERMNVKYQFYKGASHTNVFPQGFPNALLYIYNDFDK